MSNRSNRGPRAWFATTFTVAALLGCGDGAVDVTCSEYFADTPTRLTEKAPGVVHDADTNLLWFQCNLGQTYVDGACVGQPSNVNFDATLATLDTLSADGAARLVETKSNESNNPIAASELTWRMPTEAEYDSLTDVPCHSPKMDVTSFLDIRTDTYYWSSSEGRNDTYACATRLNDGLRTCQIKKTSVNPTLLVASAP